MITARSFSRKDGALIKHDFRGRKISLYRPKCCSSQTLSQHTVVDFIHVNVHNEASPACGWETIFILSEVIGLADGGKSHLIQEVANTNWCAETDPKWLSAKERRWFVLFNTYFILFVILFRISRHIPTTQLGVNDIWVWYAYFFLFRCCVSTVPKRGNEPWWLVTIV